MKYFAIIVAGGNGKRMQHAVPKQFRLLNGLPVLCHTISAFSNSPLHPEIILVLNPSLKSVWAELCTTYKFNIPHQVIDGGEERFFSVKSGLNTINETGIIAIHDAVRPLISSALITQLFNEAAVHGNAIAAIKPSESVRYQQKSINREEVVLVQTPQVFKSELIKEAYLQPYHASFTDDATVAEANGATINLVAGERANLKITWEDDLLIAEKILEARG